jgi:hypothetical protein
MLAIDYLIIKAKSGEIQVISSYISFVLQCDSTYEDTAEKLSFLLATLQEQGWEAVREQHNAIIYAYKSART